jgi:hypothetical protein
LPVAELRITVGWTLQPERFQNSHQEQQPPPVNSDSGMTRIIGVAVPPALGSENMLQVRYT